MAPETDVYEEMRERYKDRASKGDEFAQIVMREFNRLVSGGTDKDIAIKAAVHNASVRGSFGMGVAQPAAQPVAAGNPPSGGSTPTPLAPFRTCSRCNKQITVEEWNVNTVGADHYCDGCFLSAFLATGASIEVDCWNCDRNNIHLVQIHADRRCPDCSYLFNLVRCPNCRGWMDRNAPRCRRCSSWVNPGHMRTAKSLKETTGKKISSKLYEILIYMLAGIFVIFGLPFFLTCLLCHF